MTGATYAALPQGPQLDNYAELAEYIREANESKSEPLNGRRKRYNQQDCEMLSNKYFSISGISRRRGVEENER